MQSRQGARRRRFLAVVLALVVSACGSGTRESGTPAGTRPPTTQLRPALALAATEIELAPPVDGPELTVVVTNTTGASDPGLDAAVATLQSRPDVATVVVLPGGDERATTMSGVPVREVAEADPVAAAIETLGIEPDLVVVGIGTTAGPGDDSTAPSLALAASAVAHDVPALVVHAERSAGVDYAAASMQLLEVLDFELGTLLDDPPAVYTLTVPSCRVGTLRGRRTVTPAAEPAAAGTASDCTAPDPGPRASELAAFEAGFATLAELR